MHKAKLVKRSLQTVGCLLFIFFLIRSLSPQEIDDVTPGIPCEEALLNKVDVLWIVPFFNDESIATNKTWCAEILSLNKTLGLHGIHHTYNEFDTLRNESYLQPGIKAFQDCFNQTPALFKAPRLALSSENAAWLKKSYGISGPLGQSLHKVYHCNDTGRVPNKLMRWI
ncbi:hypothetical protein EXS73_01270 [Candidatus Pacearchaeota archaeon]|nr:hypothetical protein [Candidatus Pacearchaeota archaeon]